MISKILAAESGIHISLKAEPLFKLGALTVTNAMVYGVVTSAFIIWLLRWASKKITVDPKKGFSQVIEILVDFVIKLLEGPFGSRAKAVKFAPIFGTFFLFIILTNILGIIPLVGPGFELTAPSGDTPLFRPFTADLNGTIAMSLIAIIIVQILSIREQGGRKHLQHYFSDKPWNPINFFIGILEVFGEFTRVLSLSLRLFLNTAVGEILIAVFTSMVLTDGKTPFAVIPILLFEVLVAGIQAYVFTILSATYLGLAISHAHDDSHDQDHQPAKIPEEVESRGMHGG